MFATYFNACFTMDQFGSMMGLKRSSHNMEVGMEVLVKATIMEISKNEVNQDVYGLVASIKHHIDYRNQDEEKIKQKLKNCMLMIIKRRKSGKVQHK